MMKRVKHILLSLSFFAYFLLPNSVNAAPPKLDEVGGILANVLDLILPIGGLIALAMIVYGGYMWMLSSGDPGKLKQAQGTLTWAILGLIFLAIFRTALKGIMDFLGN